MARLIQRLARLSALLVFFIIFFIGLFSSASLNVDAVAVAAAKAAVGGALFWILGVVLCDITVKGLLESLDVDEESKWGGGVLSRLVLEKEKMARAGIREQEPAEPAAAAPAKQAARGK